MTTFFLSFSLWLFCKITDVAIIGKFLRILFLFGVKEREREERKWARYRVIIARFWGWELYGFFLSKLAEVILKQEVCLITPCVKRIACASLSLSKTCRLIKTDAVLALWIIFEAIGQLATHSYDHGSSYGYKLIVMISKLTQFLTGLSVSKVVDDGHSSSWLQQKVYNL